MILVCSFCKTRYLISAGVFAQGPRRVRCARCSHSWEADLPKEIDAVMPPVIDLTPIPETVAPIPPGSNLPVIQKRSLSPRMLLVLEIGEGVIILIILLILILCRQGIAGMWPRIDLYNAIGLHIAHSGEGLSLDNVRSELRYDSGIMKLVVEGKIHNGTPYIQEIPSINAVAIGADGKPIQSWQIDAPAPKLDPDETIAFQSTINAPQGTIDEINLSFIEIKHDDK